MVRRENLLDIIKNKLPQFSKGQKLIANYILANYETVAFMTAAKLGELVGVSESTAVRFANIVGCSGYPQLQEELQEIIKTKLTSVQRMEVTSKVLNNENILKSVLHSDMDKIKHTIEEIDYDEFDKIVGVLLEAKKIYIVGFRSAASVAQFLAFYLNFVLDNVMLVGMNPNSEVFEQIFKINKDAAIIGISFPRYSKRTLKALKYAHDKGAKVIALTDNDKSPLVEYADNNLYARTDMTSFVDSLVAPMSLINALVIAVGMKKKKDVTAKFEQLEKIWDEYQVYQKDER